MWRRWREERRLGLASRKRAAAGAAVAHVGDHVALCRILDRYKIYVDTRDMSVAPHLMLDGQWEMWVTRALAGLLRPGMHVADIGANLGYFSLLMADRVGAGGHVHAFEPNGRLAGLLRRSAIVNGFRNWLTVHETALGRTDGEALRLVMLDDEMGSGNLQHPEAGGDGPVIETRRMDGLPGMDRVALVKIDAEGAEPAIWDGMAAMLAGDALRTVLIEFTPGLYDDPAAFLDRLTAPGFSLAIIDQRDGVQPMTREAVLALPPEIGPMLVLRR